MKLGVWVSNAKNRRDRPTTDQLASLAKLGVAWAWNATAASVVELEDRDGLPRPGAVLRRRRHRRRPAGPVQVADRWHLWRNLSEAAERAVAKHRRCLSALVPAAPEPEPHPEEDPSGSPWPTGHRFAERTRARHAAVRALLVAGHSRRSIPRQLGDPWRTVKQLADVAAPEELFTGQWQSRPSVLDDYKPYLDDRWNEGITNAWKLWEEIVPLGYKGSYQRVRAYQEAH
ncbi:hypothetical protein ACFQ9B_30400, partial [Streptomyces sp. NPDC056549]